MNCVRSVMPRMTRAGDCAVLSTLMAATVATSVAPAAAQTSESTQRVVVTGSAIGGRDDAYTAKQATAATKGPASILDTPVAVQVIPKELIDDRQIVSIQEAVKAVSGVQTPTSVYYDVFSIRGFSTGSDIFRNGLHLNGVIGAEDMAFVDRIEIVKGPNSILYGRIQPGGMVNIVTKSPQPAFAGSVQQQFGSWGQMRTTADFTGPIDDGKSALYRVMAVYDKGDSFIDFQHHRNAAAAGYFAFKPNRRFEANLQLEYYDQKMTSPAYAAQMIPYVGDRPAPVPVHRTQNDEVMWSRWPNTVKRTTVGFDWTYAFSDGWKVIHKLVTYHADEVQTYLLYQAFSAATGLMNRRISYNPVERNELSTSLDLTGKFTVGDTTHAVLVGADYFAYNSTFTGYNESGSTLNRVPALDIHAPVYGNIDVARMQAYFDEAASNVLSKARWRSRGLYLQDQISIGNAWQILLGGRYDLSRYLGSKIYATVSQPCYPRCDGALDESVPTERQFSPRAGVLYKVSPDFSAYASYSKSFGNSNGSAASFNGTAFAPEQGVQFEAGVKAQFLGGSVVASATVFDLKLRNRLTADPDHSGFSIAVGEVRSRGLELDLSGKVTNQVDLIASLTLDKATITRDNTVGAGNTQGKYWAGVPLRNASVWARYDTAPAATEGFVFGGGVYLNSERQGNNANTVQLPGYARVDLMAGYRTRLGGRAVTAQINVQNVLDQRTFEYGGGSYAAYGAPRGLTLGVKVDL